MIPMSLQALVTRPLHLEACVVDWAQSTKQQSVKDTAFTKLSL